MMRISLTTLFFISVLLPASTQTTAELFQQIENGDFQEKLDGYVALTDIWGYNRSDSALWASEKAIDIAHQIGTYRALAHAYNVAGIYYGDVGLYDVAIESGYKAISYYDSSNIEDKEELIASAYHNLAWYYAYMEDYSQPVKLFHQGMRGKVDSSSLTVSFHALGSYFYIYKKVYDSAIFYLEKAIIWRQLLGYEIEIIAQTEVELCQAYYESDQFSKGDEVLSILEAYDQAELSSYVKNYILFLKGMKAHRQQDYNLALSYFDPVYEWGQEAELFYSSTGINFMRQYVETHKMAERYEKAYRMLEFLREIERETIYKDRQRLTKALEIRNETARKEQQLIDQGTIIAQQNRIITIVSIASIIILSLFVVLFLTYKRIQKKNTQIETLMRELHHRVKNNLQVISSLLGLQSSKPQDASAQKAVEEGQERIRAMSLIHQKLYQQDDVSSVNLKEYLETLVTEISESYGYANKAELRINVPKMPMDVDTTMPIGLIVNELVSNSFKYAFRDIQEPILELELVEKTAGKYQFSIKDNGGGFPKDFSFEGATSFGLKLVRLLVKQLGAKMSISQDEGLEYKISFSN